MSNQSATWRRVAIAIAVASFVTVSAAVRADEGEKPWDRSIALGLSLTSGNSSTLLLTGAIKGQKTWTSDELRLALTGSYGRDNYIPYPAKKVNNETLDAMAQYNHLFSERFYGLALVDFYHDGIADLKWRLTVGPGLGYYVIKSEQTKLGLEVGGALIEAKQDNTPVGGYFTLRVADRFDHKLNDRAKIWQQTEWLPQVDDFQNYLLNSEVGAEAALTKAMSLRVVGTHRYNSQPAAGRKYSDFALVSALAYKF